MKEYRSPSGERRLWFEPSEIEEIVADELKGSGMFPDSLDPVVDLETFLETGLGVKLDLYARLDSDVLGVTKFIRNERPLVSISSELTEAADSGEVLPGLWGDGGQLRLMRRPTWFCTECCLRCQPSRERCLTLGLIPDQGFSAA